jgi:hypothetical protein
MVGSAILLPLGDISCALGGTVIQHGLTYSANADLISRLKEDRPLYSWDRDRFYGPFLDNEVGYTIHQVRDFSGERDHLKGQLA